MTTIKEEYQTCLETNQKLLGDFILWLIKEKGISPDKDSRNVGYILKNYDVRNVLDEIAQKREG